ncbi:MAG: hypothetical protein ACR2FH_07070, partial [Caulobacteraceae bacterium]
PAPIASAGEDAQTAGKPFVASGTIYGPAGSDAALILQARKPTSLIVRGQGGAVYFARQLAAGEAWRAPILPGLVADAAEPASLEVFVGGVSRGALLQAQTPLARLAGPMAIHARAWAGGQKGLSSRTP